MLLLVLYPPKLFPSKTELFLFSREFLKLLLLLLELVLLEFSKEVTVLETVIEEIGRFSWSLFRLFLDYFPAPLSPSLLQI